MELLKLTAFRANQSGTAPDAAYPANTPLAMQDELSSHRCLSGAQAALRNEREQTAGIGFQSSFRRSVRYF
ncbi:MAG: hypothetical protein U0105_10140 [Candidatus Obscuribacterales bacterium]